jgi:hypothetical protein
MNNQLKVFIVLAVMLTSCYNQRKASQQVDKATNKYPEMVADKTRTRFPCITTGIDSVDFLNSIAERDSMLLTLDSAINASWFKNESLLDIIKRLQVDSSGTVNCAEFIKKVEDFADEKLRENEALRGAIAKLRTAANTVKPIIRSIKDSAEIFIAQAVAARAVDTANKWRAQYYAEHELRKEYQNRLRGAVPVKWWVFVIIAVLLGIYFRKSIKSIFMKSVISIMAALFLMTTTQSCVHFKDEPNKWVFSEGLWIIPLVLFAGFVKFFIDTVRIHKHGSWKIASDGSITGQEGGKIPYWKIGRAYIALGMLAGFLYMVFNTIANR